MIFLDQAHHKFGEENGASVSKNGTVLLGAVRLNDKLTIVGDSTFEHDSAWLINGDLLVSKESVEVGDSAIAVRDTLLALPCVNHVNEALKVVFLQLLL